jgi:hypothetical protein
MQALPKAAGRSAGTERDSDAFRRRVMSVVAVRITAVMMCVLTVVACTGSPPHRPPLPEPTAIADESPTASPSISTCGTVPVSDGTLKTALDVTIEGPAAAPSGSTFTANVAITTTQPAIDLSSSTVVTLLIAQRHAIVGRSLLPGAALAFEPRITPSAPAALTGSIVVAGCAIPPIDPTNADLTRKPLPQGAYTVYAVVVEYDGDSETDQTDLVSAPFPVQVTQSLASPS